MGLLILLGSGCATQDLEAPPNRAPIANAGDDRRVEVGEEVVLDASESRDPDGDEITFRWSLRSPTGSTAQLSSTNDVTTTLVPDVEGEYEVSLVATDGLADSTPDTVRIVADAATTTENRAPQAVVVAPTEVEVGMVVTLDGTGSTDPDGDPLFYDWLIEGQPVDSRASLDDPFSPTPQFTPDVAGDYEISLVVSDSLLDSSPEAVIITATGAANRAPIADAGRDVSVPTGSSAELDGTESSDPDGDALEFNWSLIDIPTGSSATLSASDVARPILETDVEGTYVAQLVVSDGELESEPDTVTVNAVTGNVPPNANAGPDQTVDVGTTVQLDGTNSFDAEDDPLGYLWSFASKPAASDAAFSNPTAPAPTFVADVEGQFVIDLVVNDGRADSAVDSVTVTAIEPNLAPTADAGADIETRVGETVTLDGSGSSDPDGDPLSYEWGFVSVPAGSNVALAGATTASPSFVPDVAGTYTVSLTVDDGDLTDVDMVTIIVAEPWPTAEGEVIITEVMADPDTLSDAVGEWFEIYNPTATTWNLRGCVLEDLDIDQHTIEDDLVVAPMTYATLAKSANPGFGPDYSYDGKFHLANNEDEIIITCGGNEISNVVLSTVFGFPSPMPTGASLALLRDKLDEVENDDGANWCVSTTDYNGDSGTPGAPNEFQSACP